MKDGLYVDGGVIGRNPSSVGGTWAFCLVKNGFMFQKESGVITPTVAQLEKITNNLTEMLALVQGMKALPPYYHGNIYSDSAVTIGRVSMGWKWKNIPNWLHSWYHQARGRLVNYEDIKFVQLDGHPTKQQLETGIGKRGNPVSKWNVWCDQECNLQSLKYLSNMKDKGENHGRVFLNSSVSN